MIPFIGLASVLTFAWPTRIESSGVDWRIGDLWVHVSLLAAPLLPMGEEGQCVGMYLTIMTTLAPHCVPSND